MKFKGFRSIGAAVVLTLAQFALPGAGAQAAVPVGQIADLPGRVGRGETLMLQAGGVVLRDALGRDLPVAVQETAGGLRLKLPSTLSGGHYFLETTGPRTRTPLTVVGDAQPGRLIALIDRAALSPGLLDLALKKRQMRVVARAQLAGAAGTGGHIFPADSAGPCGQTLIEVEFGGQSLSQALASLAGVPGVLLVDAQTLWGVDQEMLWAKEPTRSTLSAVTAPDFDFAGAGKSIRVSDTSGLSHESSVRVAVLDSAVLPSSELGERLLPGVGFVTPERAALPGPGQGHGQAVAERIAGSVSGVARSATVLPIQVCDGAGTCRASDVVEGICWAVYRDGAEILNLSLGGDTPNALVRAVLARELSHGVVVVASNRGRYTEHFPAGEVLPGLISVGAARRTTAGWSRVGNEALAPDLLAPGATEKDQVGGSSFASALVAGAAAHLRSKCPHLSPEQLEGLLGRYARPERLVPADRLVSGAGLLYIPARLSCS